VPSSTHLVTPVRIRQCLAGVRALFGAALLLSPATVLHDVPHRRIDGRARAFARLLGIRHLLQAAGADRHPTRGWVLAGATVDGTHAASMIMLARWRPDRRRLALTNAGVATLLALGGLVEAGFGIPLPLPQPGPREG